LNVPLLSSGGPSGRRASNPERAGTLQSNSKSGVRRAVRALCERSSGGYQSEPGMSPPAGATRADHVSKEIPDGRKRTLPSTITTFIPPMCIDCGRVGSQPPEGLVFLGFWNVFGHTL